MGRWLIRLAFLLMLACLLAAPRWVRAGKFNRVLSVGDVAPPWENLEGTDGRRHSLAELSEARLVVLIFTSHRCPIARGYDERLVELYNEVSDAGVRMVAIESGGPAERTLEKMRQRAQEAGYHFAYLHDAGLNLCRAYGATCTPTVFVLVPRADERCQPRFAIAYQGAIDDSADARRVRRPYLRQTIEALLAGRQPPMAETRPTGCEIPGSQDNQTDSPDADAPAADGP